MRMTARYLHPHHWRFTKLLSAGANGAPCLAVRKIRAQFYHATKLGQQRMVQLGFSSDKASDRIKILGYALQGVQARKAVPAECTWLQKAIHTAAKVRCLPGTLARKIRIGQHAVSSKASFGWVCRRPSKADIKPFEAACRALVQKPQQASPFLYKIMRGHLWDLRFLAIQDLSLLLGCKASCRLSSCLRQVGHEPLRLGWGRLVGTGLILGLLTTVQLTRRCVFKQWGARCLLKKKLATGFVNLGDIGCMTSTAMLTDGSIAMILDGCLTTMRNVSKSADLSLLMPTP